MTTGARRGELCALRWTDIDTDGAVMSLDRSIAFDPERRRWFEKATKSHQSRRVALDAVSVEVLTEHRARCTERAAALGESLASDAFVFSLEPDGATWLVPSSVTQRYERMVGRAPLEIDTTLHKLRHYSATELISAGVDVRTVAGRLGHGGGGATTLRVYSAWVSEADQRASTALAARGPDKPQDRSPSERAKTDPRNPYESLAAGLRKQILDGDLAPGQELPSVKDLAGQHEVSVSTVQRAIVLLRTWNLVDVARRRRTKVVEFIPEAVRVTGDDSESSSGSEQVRDGPPTPSTGGAKVTLDLRLMYLGENVRPFRSRADPTDHDQLEQLLQAAVRRHGGRNADLAEYELEVRRAGESALLTCVASL